MPCKSNWKTSHFWRNFGSKNTGSANSPHVLLDGSLTKLPLPDRIVFAGARRKWVVWSNEQSEYEVCSQMYQRTAWHRNASGPQIHFSFRKIYWFLCCMISTCTRPQIALLVAHSSATSEGTFYRAYSGFFWTMSYVASTGFKAQISS